MAPDLDRSPPVFLREPDQIGKGVWVFRLDAIRRDGRDRLFVVRASIELVANPAEPRVQLGGHFHRTPAACLAFLRSEEHTSELPSLMRISSAVFCLQTKNKAQTTDR